MDIRTTSWFFEKLKKDKLCLLYNGNISDKLTNKFIDLSEFYISDHIEKKKVSFLLAECVQNIVRHGVTKSFDEDYKENPGYFLTKNINNTYFITSGNLINKKNIIKLEDKLTKINSLEQSELKELFRKVMGTNEISSKGGAGLGLIEMARKSGHKIEFSFNEYNDDFSFFYNQIVLSQKNDGLNLEKKIDFPISASIDFHIKMKDKNILLIQKGDFSQESILPVLNIIQQNLGRDSRLPFQNKSVYHVLVELLQNISKHSLKENNQNEGILLIGKNGTNTIITTGNYMDTSKIKTFEKTLKILQTSNKEELKTLYLKKLKEGKETIHGGADIGLIDIAKESTRPIKFHFDTKNGKKVFYTIQATI